MLAFLLQGSTIHRLQKIACFVWKKADELTVSCCWCCVLNDIDVCRADPRRRRSAQRPSGTTSPLQSNTPDAAATAAADPSGSSKKDDGWGQVEQMRNMTLEGAAKDVLTCYDTLVMFLVIMICAVLWALHSPCCGCVAGAAAGV